MKKPLKIAIISVSVILGVIIIALSVFAASAFTREISKKTSPAFSRRTANGVKAGYLLHNVSVIRKNSS